MISILTANIMFYDFFNCSSKDQDRHDAESQYTDSTTTKITNLLTEAKPQTGKINSSLTAVTWDRLSVNFGGGLGFREEPRTL